MPRPNVFLIGVEKAGTTSLAHYMGEHPDVFALVHHPSRFFSLGDARIAEIGRETKRSAKEHWALFAKAGDERVVAETQPAYFPVARTPPRIHHYAPDAKLVVVLRQPAWRAWSHFQFLQREALEPLSDFGEALDAEEARQRDDWHYRYFYRDTGRYARHLRQWFDHFPKDRFLILRYEELRDRPGDVVREVYRFLDVAEDFRPDFSKRYNLSGTPRTATARVLLGTARPLRRWLARRLPHPLVQAARRTLTRREDPPLRTLERLTREFREDMEELEELLGWDLSNWKETDRAHRAGRSRPLN